MPSETKNKKILVAVDGSASSDRALDVAVQIAAPLGASILLVHGTPPLLLSPEVYSYVVQDLERLQREEGEAILEAARKRISGSGLKVETRLVPAPIADSLVDLAEAEGVYMLAVGSRGRGAVARVLLGSVADRVTHISKRPVLIVH